MRWIKAITFLFICCSSAMAVTQKLTMDVKSTPNEWDSAGTGNKVAMLNDAVDNSYIKSLTVSDTDRYVVTNMASLDTTILNAIDSVKIFWKMRGTVGAGTSTGRVGLGINTDYLEGATRTFAVLAEGAWSSFTENFPIPPGSRGDWDVKEVDSLICQIRMVSFTATEVPAVTSCSLLVYYAADNPQSFYFTNNDGCETGSNFGKWMVPSYDYPIWIDTIKVVVPANTTENDYFATYVDLPRSKEWNTGPSAIWLNLIKQVNPDSLRVRLLKVDSLCGTIHDSTAWTAKQSIAIGKIQQTLDPDGKGTVNNWDSTGTGTKVQMITDATDGNYIYSSSVIAKPRDYYTLEDFTLSTYEFGDIIDSVKLFTTAQDNGTGNNQYRPNVRVGADSTLGTGVLPSTSWVQYTDIFTAPPGSRGTWDVWEIDSLQVAYEVITLGAIQAIRVTNCSTVVYITKAMVKINLDNHNWAAGQCNNRLQLQFEWTNPAAASEDTIWFRVGSEAQSRIETQIVQRLSPCGDTVGLAAGCVTQDSILPNDTVLAFNQWANTGGSSKVASITDATDANYIFEVTNGQAQQFTYANQGIPANAIIDSIRVEAWAQRTSGGSATRFTHRIMKDGVTTQYCDGTQKTLTTSWAAYADGFKGFVSGGGACNNLFTRARLDSLNVRFIKNTGNEVRVTRSVIYICYTVPSACEFTLNDENSAIDDAMLNVSLPTTNFGTYGFLDIWDINTTLGQRQSVIKWDVLKDSIVNRTVASATLRFNPESSTATTMMTYIRGLRRAWTESEVTWNNATTAVAWATAGAGDASTDRYSDILDSFVIADTNSSGWTELNVTSYLQLCDGTDTTNYKGWILTPKQNSGINTYWSGASSEHTTQILSPQLTVNYCTAGAPSKKRRRKIIMSSVDEIETRGAGEFAKLGDFSAEPIIGFTDNSWLWGEDKEWTVNPRVRFEIIDSEEEK